jgi:hypothetical protein
MSQSDMLCTSRTRKEPSMACEQQERYEALLQHLQACAATLTAEERAAVGLRLVGEEASELWRWVCQDIGTAQWTQRGGDGGTS